MIFDCIYKAQYKQKTYCPFIVKNILKIHFAKINRRRQEINIGARSAPPNVQTDLRLNLKIAMITKIEFTPL